MVAIHIRFVTEADLVSDAIRIETWSAFSHVEFLLDDGTTLGAHSKGGVQIRPANYARFTNTEVYAIPVTDEQKVSIMAFAHAQVGKPYDYTAIAGILTHRDWREDDSWFCSELVAAAFDVALPLLNAPSKVVNRITPQNVYLSPLLIGNRVA